MYLWTIDGSRCAGAMLLAAACFALAPPPARAQASLAFEQAIAIAQARSLRLRAHDAAIRAAQDMAVAAGQLPDPVVKAGISNLPVNGADRFSIARDFMTMRSIGVMQEFTRSDKRAARAARYESQAQAVAAEREAALAELQRGTAAAWFDLHYAQQIEAMLVEQRDETRLQVDAADAAYRAARGAQADVFAARGAVAHIDDRLAQARREIDTARSELARWIGEASALPLGSAPPGDRLPFAAEALAAHLQAHPRLQVLDRQRDTRQADAQIAQSNQRADWTVELMVSQRGSRFSDMVSVQVSIPLQLDRRHRQDRELSARLAAVDQIEAERQEAQREVQAQANALLVAWRNSRERLAFYASTILPLATQRRLAALAGYRAGSGTLDSVLAARRDEIDARIDQLRIAIESARLWTQLAYLIPAPAAAGTHPRSQP